MEKINIAELLKDCPKGMELECTMFDGVYFDHVDDLRHNGIKCYVNNGNEHFKISLDEHGQYISNNSAKCVIFPKGKTSWEGFQRPFKDGDIVFYNGTIAIFKELGDETLFRTYCVFYTTVSNPTYQFETSKPLFGKSIRKEARFATEEEKEKLFQAIKENCLRWNSKNKTLEVLVKPKFKVGNRIQWYGNHVNHSISVVKSLECDRYRLDNGSYVKFGDEHAYKLLKFDISSLIPFESKVLVRNDEGQYWIPAFWGCKRTDGYTTTFGWCKYCIPFEGNEHLLETTNDCNEYYKTWEE